MNPEDVFLGPLLRRAEEGLVVVCLATYRRLPLKFSVCRASGGPWLAHDASPLEVKVFDGLYFYLARIRPAQGKPKLPTGELLAYSIAITSGPTPDYGAFERLVAADKLAYDPHTLPTFFLQRRGRALNLLYGSCRKIHDTHGGTKDALAEGDSLIAKAPSRLEERPALLVLGGDQIYADELHQAVFQQVLGLAGRLEAGAPESLPGPPLGADRKTVLSKVAKLTSDDLKTHVATFAEYLALYGLSWNQRCWTRPPKEMEHFTSTLPKVRRLLANCPAYMIFDDHDVTDDWNLSVQWREAVYGAPLGRRIVANGLMAYWLCQGLGNDPDATDPRELKRLASLVEKRAARYGDAEKAFWAIDTWEFATPTTPFVYFLDTRTQRGAKDDPGSNKRAPAYLKSVRSWDDTMARLRPMLRQQAQREPIVLVAAAPVFGFEWIDFFQKVLVFFTSEYKYDFESWAANEAQMAHVLKLLSGRNVVLLSGDVHYGYTSTVSYTVFDSRSLHRAPAMPSPTGALPSVPTGALPSYRPVATSQILQLTSSAVKNAAGGWKTRWPAGWSRTKPGKVVTEDGSVLDGHYENGHFVMVEMDAQPEDPFGGLGPVRFELAIRSPQDVQPVTAYRQRVNDEYNSRYLEDHNLGFLALHGPTVRHRFLTVSGPQSERTFDFTNPRYFA